MTQACMLSKGTTARCQDDNDTLTSGTAQTVARPSRSRKVQHRCRAASDRPASAVRAPAAAISARSGASMVQRPARRGHPLPATARGQMHASADRSSAVRSTGYGYIACPCAANPSRMQLKSHDVARPIHRLSRDTAGDNRRGSLTVARRYSAVSGVAWSVWRIELSLRMMWESLRHADCRSIPDGDASVTPVAPGCG
jgi:hypothetical protein